MENFRRVVKSGTSFNPNKVELGIIVGQGRFGAIHRAMFNAYNGSVHDVNVYMLKNILTRSNEELIKLASLLNANILAGAHQNVVSLCGVSQVGNDVMLMWEPLHQSVLRGVLRESRCARFGTEPFNMASFLSSERLAAIAIGCCNGVEHLLKKNVFPAHLSASNVLLAERGIVKIGGFGLAEHHALDMASESVPTKLRWMSPEYFKRDHKMVHNEQTIIWPLGVTLWEIFSLGGTPFASFRQVQTFIDSMRDGSAHLDPITYCGEAVTQLLSTCTAHIPDARGDIRTIIKRLECIQADAKTQINLSFREDFPYLPIVTQLEQQVE
uniref:Protein kinase domain-containing protein n=1 Tax=Caenorhabditis japonica TaxID=281687 RepID=A0A8R1DP36_CAEJA